MAPIELPFLSQTRTILLGTRSFATLTARLRPPQPTTGRPPLPSSPSEPANVVASHTFFVQKANEARIDSTKPGSIKAGVKSSTITPTEQKTFHRIFGNIIRETTENDGQDVITKSHSDINHENILQIFSSSIKDYHAERQKRSSTLGASVSDQSTSSPQRHNELISRYPEPLRGAARQAIKATLEARKEAHGSRHNAAPRETDSQHHTQSEVTFKPLDATHEKGRKEAQETLEGSSAFMRPSFLNELLSIEENQVARHQDEVDEWASEESEARDDGEEAAAAHRAAIFERTVDDIARREMSLIAQSFGKTILEAKAVDMAIWDVCQRQVFPMLDHLDLQSMPGSQATTTTPLEAPDEAATASSSEGDGVEDESRSWKLSRLPPYVPPLSIVSRLYPASLLLAIRLFAKHSPTSPWALALLPQLRALGPTSYVLGGTSHFYNALIKLQWDAYSDLPEIHNLLNEMEKGGIELDGETYQILETIGGDRWADMGRSAKEMIPRGGRSKSWWQRGEQVKWFQKVGVEWKQLIAARLREQGQSVSAREYGGDGRRSPSLTHDAASEAPAVWM